MDVDRPALVPAGVERPEEREPLRIGALDASQEALVRLRAYDSCVESQLEQDRVVLFTLNLAGQR